MTTFDLAGVRAFVSDVDARLDRCDNGEGLMCANLDDTLRHYARVCCEYREAVRHWGREVFAGRAAFDPEVETELLAHGEALYHRAQNLFAYGEEMADGPCYALEGRATLRAALLGVYELLTKWVTPALSVGPSARGALVLAPEVVAAMRARLAALPPLPADWQPADARQRRQFKKLRNS